MKKKRWLDLFTWTLLGVWYSPSTATTRKEYTWWQQSFRLWRHTIYIIVDNLAGVETLHHDAVLVQLVLRLHPLRLPLFPAHGETYFLIVSHIGILQSQMRGAKLCQAISLHIEASKRRKMLQRESEGVYWEMFYPLRMERFGGRSCKLWKKFSLVFSCWQTHCLSQSKRPSPILIFFRSAAFSKRTEIWIILSWMWSSSCKSLSSIFPHSS